MSSVVLMLDRYAMVKSRPRRFSTAICMYYLCAASVGMSYSVCRKVDAEGNVYKMIIIITGNITVNDSTNRRSNGLTKLEAKQKTKVREMEKKKFSQHPPLQQKYPIHLVRKEKGAPIIGGWEWLADGKSMPQAVIEYIPSMGKDKHMLAVSPSAVPRRMGS